VGLDAAVLDAVVEVESAAADAVAEESRRRTTGAEACRPEAASDGMADESRLAPAFALEAEGTGVAFGERSGLTTVLLSLESEAADADDGARGLVRRVGPPLREEAALVETRVEASEGVVVVRGMGRAWRGGSGAVWPQRGWALTLKSGMWFMYYASVGGCITVGAVAK
jgi:hypothetical protein